MNIIHLASFGGNFGDVLNHQGFYNTVGNALGFKTVRQIEVRRFYKNASEEERLFFNEDFVNEINNYDLFVVGGGGFFDAKWAYSNTGTTIDFSDSFIDGIKVPVVINAMGYHEFFEDSTQEVFDKFEKFIQKVLDKGWFVSFRNDGSINRFHNRFGNKYDDRIISVPDNGFFGINNNNIKPVELPSEKSTIGLCLTNDLFSKSYNGDLDTDSFNSKILEVLETLSAKFQIVLFAHTPDDVVRVGQYFEKLPNSTKRYNIVVCPYMPNGANSINEMTRFYSACDIIVGMRFHSLIMGLQLGKPTIALANHQQISDFFDELNLPDYCVPLNNKGFVEKLFTTIRSGIYSGSPFRERIDAIMRLLKNGNEQYIINVRKYLGT